MIIIPLVVMILSFGVGIPLLVFYVQNSQPIFFGVEDTLAKRIKYSISLSAGMGFCFLGGIIGGLLIETPATPLTLIDLFRLFILTLVITMIIFIINMWHYYRLGWSRGAYFRLITYLVNRKKRKE